MAVEAADHWNERYNKTKEINCLPRSFLLENLHFLPPQGYALDLAMGTGNNSALLINRGYKVLGIDISIAGLKLAKSRKPGLMCIVADLEEYFLPPYQFDVILNLYYFQRNLLKYIRRIIKPGGVVVCECLTEAMLLIKPDINPDYLLKPGELFVLFSGWERLVYREGWFDSDHGHEKCVAGIIARA